MSYVEIDGVKMKEFHVAVQADAQTVKLIKEYIRRSIEIQNKIDMLKEELKELKHEYQTEGINVKAVNRALASYKRKKKLNPAQLSEMEMIEGLIEEDADLSAKVATIL